MVDIYRNFLKLGVARTKKLDFPILIGNYCLTVAWYGVKYWGSYCDGCHVRVLFDGRIDYKFLH